MRCPILGAKVWFPREAGPCLRKAAEHLGGEIAEVLAGLARVLRPVGALVRPEVSGRLQRGRPQDRLFKTSVIGVLPQPTLEVLVCR
jgi:hypothetical protein